MAPRLLRLLVRLTALMVGSVLAAPPAREGTRQAIGNEIARLLLQARRPRHQPSRHPNISAVE